MLKGRFALLIALCFLIAQPVIAGEKFALPDEMRGLIPADVVAVIGISSLDESNAAIATLEGKFAEDGDEAVSVSKLLADQMPDILNYLDPSRPFLIAADMPDLMMQEAPGLTYILPIKDGVTVDDSLGSQWSLPGQALSGRYLALSSSAEYLPAALPGGLSDHMNAGVISMTLDFAAIFGEYGGFLEMGLAGIPVRENGTLPDSTGTITVDEAEALKDILRSSLSSITRIDLSCDLDDDDFAVFGGLGIVPGSSLDPGPQPNFSDAIALTGALPANADFVQVTAFDYTRIMDTFREYYLMTASQSMVGLDAEQRANYRAWVENYLDSIELWSQPMATALRLADSQMAFHGLMEVDDGKAAVEQLTEIFAGLSALDLGYTVERQSDEEVAGVDFRVWEVDLDLEKIESMVTANPSPSMGGGSRVDAEQMIAVLRKVMSRVYVGSQKGHLFLASDGDTKGLAEMVKKAGKKRKPNANIVRIAKENGAGTQQVITGDMMAVANWFTEWLEEMDDEEREVLEGNPVPFEAIATIGNGETGVVFKTSLAALGDLYQAFEALEAAEKGEK